MVIDADVSVCCGVSAPVLMLRLQRASAVWWRETCSSEGEATQLGGLCCEAHSAVTNGPVKKQWSKSRLAWACTEIVVVEGFNSLGPFKFLVTKRTLGFKAGVKAARGEESQSQPRLAPTRTTTKTKAQSH